MRSQSLGEGPSKKADDASAGSSCPDALEREAMCCKVLERRLGKAERNGPLADTATRENASSAQVLSERCDLAVTAARLAPPAYIRRRWGRGPAIQISAGVGSRGSRPSRATVRSMASRTPIGRLAGIPAPVPSVPPASRRNGAYGRFSETWAGSGDHSCAAHWKVYGGRAEDDCHFVSGVESSGATEYPSPIPPVASVAGCEARFGGPQRF